MPNNVIVLGTQWGDEGKGKVADLLTSKANIVVRSQGGNNAGHTLVVGNKKVVVRLVPSGILHKSCLCLIGSGVVVNPGALFEECDNRPCCHLRFQARDERRSGVVRHGHLRSRRPHRRMDGLGKPERRGPPRRCASDHPLRRRLARPRPDIHRPARNSCVAVRQALP